MSESITVYVPRDATALSLGADKVAQAIVDRKQVCVYGDYDVDGTTGASLLESYLRYKGADVRSFIPMRFEGYGLSKHSIERIAKEQKPELILTVDCGTSSPSFSSSLIVWPWLRVSTMR